MWRALLIAGVVSLAAGGAVENTAPIPPESPPLPDEFIVLCPINDEIDDGVAVVVERAVREAAGARAIVFLIDTPGGRVDSAIDITEHIMGARCRSVAFIHKMGAISAGALISFACDDIVMSPASNIGAALPFVPGMEPNVSLDEKSRSFVRAKFRALGEAKGHDPLLGEAMVDPDVALYGYRDADGRFVIEKDLRAGSQEEGGEEGPPPGLPAEARLISPRGNLLTLTAEEAIEFGLIEVKAKDEEEVLGHFGWAELRRVVITPTWAEALFGFLTSPLISSLLLMCGLGGLYFEVRTPGFGLPGIIGLTCLALFFGAQFIIGLADWMDVLLVLAGVVLLGVEIFVLPGFGIAGMAGIGCLFAGLYLSLTRVPVPQYTWDFVRLSEAVQTLATAAIALTAIMLISWFYLPRTRLLNWLVLAQAEA
ncbi:MAG TPA: hypothetical protein PKI11_05790, partial [Candidatus Hydrogenedentes bacterium]|nr:hypothetical protein [Candidatus Hydrogenedentota bacterium]